MSKNVQERELMTDERQQEVYDQFYDEKKPYHDTTIPLANKASLYKMFKDVRKIDLGVRGEQDEMFISVSPNNFMRARYGENYIHFADFTYYFRCPTSEITDMMVYKNCFSGDTPSIEIIQWKEHFLVILNSANLIGSFKFFAEKDDIIELFGIEIIE